MDGHGGYCLTKFETIHLWGEFINGSDEIPTWRVVHVRRFRMHPLARQHVGQRAPKAN
jgi:hypothetical protein